VHAELADAVIAVAETRNLSVIVGQAGADREHELAVLANGLKQTDGLLFSPERLGSEDRGLVDYVDYRSSCWANASSEGQPITSRCTTSVEPALPSSI
jgi:hypothetical protein